jgi:hypothetical protein
MGKRKGKTYLAIDAAGVSLTPLALLDAAVGHARAPAGQAAGGEGGEAVEETELELVG